MTTVLDSSALLAPLLGEPGGTVVVETASAAVIGAVNLAEVAGVLARKGYADAGVHDALGMLAVPVLAADEAMAIDAGLLRPLTDPAGLSLGDRFCLALARRLAAPILTADRAWRKVADAAGVEVRVIR